MTDLVSFLFVDSKDIREAEQRLIARENEIFETQPGEDKDLAMHVHYDIPRHKLLNERGALNRAMARQASNRNFVALMIVGAILLFDHHIPWDKIGAAFDLAAKAAGIH